MKKENIKDSLLEINEEGLSENKFKKFIKKRWWVLILVAVFIVIAVVGFFIFRGQTMNHTIGKAKIYTYQTINMNVGDEVFVVDADFLLKYEGRKDPAPSPRGVIEIMAPQTEYFYLINGKKYDYGFINEEFIIRSEPWEADGVAVIVVGGESMDSCSRSEGRDKNKCLESLVYKNKNYHLCDQMVNYPEYNYQQYCYDNFMRSTVKTEDLSVGLVMDVCKNITDKREKIYCYNASYQKIARRDNDSAVCELINEADDWDECMLGLFFETKYSDIDICRNLKTREKKIMCYNSYASQNKDTSYCSELTDEEALTDWGQCTMERVKLLNKSEYCDVVRYDSSRIACKLLFDSDFCKAGLSEPDLEICYRAKLVQECDYTLCEDVAREEIKAKCYDIAATIDCIEKTQEVCNKVSTESKKKKCLEKIQ